MNLILLTQSDFIDENIVTLRDRRFKHITTVLKSKLNDTVKIGIKNAKMGSGKIVAITDNSIKLKIQLNEIPPAPLNITLIVALPRPKTLKKVLSSVISMGVKKIIFIETWKVDKSYWQSPLLKEDKIEEQIVLGLEQGVDTMFPEISFKKRFKPFIEDELPNIIKDKVAYIAHPKGDKISQHIDKDIVLAIGPEGGFTDYEVDKFKEIGFNQISIGNRILRVEFAIPFTIAQII